MHDHADHGPQSIARTILNGGVEIPQILFHGHRGDVCLPQVDDPHTRKPIVLGKSVRYLFFAGGVLTGQGCSVEERLVRRGVDSVKQERGFFEPARVRRKVPANTNPAQSHNDAQGASGRASGWSCTLEAAESCSDSLTRMRRNTRLGTRNRRVQVFLEENHDPCAAPIAAVLS